METGMKKDIMRVFLPNLIKLFVTVLATFFIPRYLNVEEYGYIKVFQLYTSYIGLSCLGYCEGVFLKHGGQFLEEIPRKQLANEQTTLMTWQFVWTIAVSIVGIVSRDFITFMVGLSFLPSVMITYFLNFFQSVGSFENYGKLYNTHSILTIIADIFCLFIIGVSDGKVFVITTVVINYLVMILVLIIFNRSNKITMGRFELARFVENSQLGFLLMLGNMAYILFAGIDKWFVKINMGLTSFSYYSFAVQFLAAINMFANPIAYTLFSHFSKRKAQDFEYLMKRIMIVGLFFLLSGVFVLKRIIEMWLVKYTVSIPVLVILFYGQIFYSLNYAIYINLFKVYHEQKKYFINLLLIIVLSILMNFVFYFFISETMLSFAYATMLCMMLWTFFNLTRFPYLRLKKKDFLFVVLASCIYFVGNRMESCIGGGIVYILGYSCLLFLFMRDILKMLLKQCKR